MVQILISSALIYCGVEDGSYWSVCTVGIGLEWFVGEVAGFEWVDISFFFCLGANYLPRKEHYMMSHILSLVKAVGCHFQKL